MPSSEFVFPDGFLWGCATSAHQVEGNNIHNDWWTWEQAGRVKEPSGLACDHYRRFAKDFDIALELKNTAHRFSLEWSRIEPIEGEFNDAAIAHYREVIRALRQRNLEPVVTLHHYTNPQWLVESGSWANPKVVDYFARYVELVAKELGSQVRYWVTINEPMVYVNMHYVEGLGPPGIRDMRKALQVTEHLLRAHAAAFRILHDAASSDQSVMVSIAKHLPLFVPCKRWWPPDIWAAYVTDRLFNASFLEALTEGRWIVPGVARRSIPEARATLDYVGVNYYGREFVRFTIPSRQALVARCSLDHHSRDVTERTALGWDVSPGAFTQVLRRASRLGLPILVTENGTWMEDDARRWRYIARHLAAMAQAIDEGARVIGYLCWSLLDNFEWAHGYVPHFGIVEVDYMTQKRRIRESGRKFAEVCRTNRLTLDG